MTDSPEKNPGSMPTTATRFAVALSEHPEPAVASGEVVGRVQEQLDGPPDLAVVFAAGDFCRSLPEVADALRSLLAPRVLIGSTAVGVLGGAQEVESGTALAVWAANGTEAKPFRLESIPGDQPTVVGLPASVESGSLLLTLCDPFTTPVEAVVEQVNTMHGRPALVGGLSSAGTAPGANTLLLDGDLHDGGGVGVVMPPGVARPVVSQGCRPIGTPWVVTKGSGQLVGELAGKPALERLGELIETLGPADRALAARGLHIGVVADEQQAEFDRGDFLIRGVLGADRSSGAIAIGDVAQVGQVVQFQVRDEESASDELQRLTADSGGRSALVFTCNGRGTNMFTRPNHDAEVVYETMGEAVAGMFCAGEVGPIAGRNAVHGFTATMAVFD